MVKETTFCQAAKSFGAGRYICLLPVLTPVWIADDGICTSQAHWQRGWVTRTVDICLVNKCSRSICYVSGAVPSTGNSGMEVTFDLCPLGTAEGQEEVWMSILAGILCPAVYRECRLTIFFCKAALLLFSCTFLWKSEDILYDFL